VTIFPVPIQRMQNTYWGQVKFAVVPQDLGRGNLQIASLEDFSVVRNTSILLHTWWDGYMFKTVQVCKCVHVLYSMQGSRKVPRSGAAIYRGRAVAEIFFFCA